MTQAFRTSLSVLALGALLGLAAPAEAQISGGGGATLPWTSRWDVAYDSVNKVYLLLFDGHPSSRTLRPVMGQFADVNLQPIGGMFDITSEYATNGEAPSWATVTFGGTTSDPTFLITYLVPGEGSAIPKYGRLVRYRGGAAPSVGARSLIFPNVGGEWFAAERARPAWNGTRFIVPTRVPGGAVGSLYAQPVFSFFDVDGTVSGTTNMGTLLDYQGGPSVACSPSNVCMAAGFAAGVPYGAVGGIWARLFNGTTLQPITEVFYPDDQSIFMDTPHVVYNANTGQFNMVWYRRAGAGALDFRVVNTDGSLGPLDLSRSFTISPGEPGLSYNPVSKTSLLITKWGSEASLYALELGSDGYPRDLSNPVLITGWDGKVLEYRPAVTARTDAPHWLVTFNLAASSGVARVTGAGVGGPPPPPPPPPPAALTVSISANVTPPLAVGMGVTWTATSTGGTGVQYKFYRVTSGESWMVGQDWSADNTYTWFPPAGTHAVQVWARNSGSTAPFDAYAGTGFFIVNPGGARLTSFFADKTMPAPSNSAITWTATANSGAGAVEYLFWRHSASTGWVLGQGYSSNNKYIWFPPDGVNSLQVWVRRVGSTSDYEDYAATTFAVQPNPARFAAVTTGTVFPAAPGSPITWTAVPGGGSGAYEYKFLLLSAATNQWQILRGWSTNPQATWTPAGTGLFALQVWIRNAGSYLDYEDWRGTDWFSVSNSTALTLTATNRLLIDLRPGNFVRFQADVVGPGQWEYQFWGYAYPGIWTLRQVYTSQNWYDLTLPAGVNAVQVWIRPAGSSVPWERYQTTGYFVVQ